MTRNEANWWLFSLAKEQRGDRIKDDPAAGTREINRQRDGKRLLSYSSYLQLDRLLSSQWPGSRAPEERVFITTHQLCELAFKQTIFDLRVIADTLDHLLGHNQANFVALVRGNGPGRLAEDFWTPALTAAARAKHGCKRLLPVIMGYLAGEETFDNREFTSRFRDHLTPASGFQSAQFRLLQRALGKSHLLAVRLFPADTYLRNYLGMATHEIAAPGPEPGQAGLVSVLDPLILREEAGIAAPPASSPLHPVTRLDDLAHRVLVEIARATKGELEAGDEIPLLPASQTALAEMGRTFRNGLREVLGRIKDRANQPRGLSRAEAEMIGRRTEVFQEDWTVAVRRENARRTAFAEARRGARLLLNQARPGPLASVLQNLVATDAALGAVFLRLHRQMVARRLGEVPGTAGGGVPFLDYSRTLVNLFPALIALPRDADKIIS